MSARLNKQAPRGEAPRTARTDQSFIAGVGLAGTAAATVVLGVVIGLGAASFQIWPDSPGVPNGPAVELEVPVEVAVELPSTGLLASAASGDFPTAPTAAPVPGGGESGPSGPGLGADGALVPGAGPVAAPPVPAPGAQSGDAGAAGEDSPPGNSGDDPDTDVTPPPSHRPTPPSTSGTPGNSGGNGRGRGNGSARGSGGGRGGGNTTVVPAGGSVDTATGGQRGRNGRVVTGRGARYPR